MSSVINALPSSHAASATRESLDAHIALVREQLLAHPIYRAVNTVPRLRAFMTHHVFAVWDFMCLAKRLQRDLTSLDRLWLPPAHPSLARFINSVVHGEESDVDLDGRAASHFDLYLSAMEEVGAPTGPVRAFLARVREGAALETSLAAAEIPAPVRTFVIETMHTVDRNTTLEVLASFLFGREDLIPEMFARLLPQWTESREARRFTYYVQRHIELDGDDHGPAGQRALAEMAASDAGAWHAASQAAHAAIAARIRLWDGVYQEVLKV